MRARHSNSRISYIAEIKNVRELVLIGNADLAYWRDYLSGEELVPYSGNGGAELWISATELKWMGLRFRELTLSIRLAAREAGRTRDAAYLLHAFNSSRLLSSMERAFFQTPYDYGSLQLETRVPACFELSDRDETLLKAQMSGNPVCSRTGEQIWEGSIFLSRRGVTAAHAGSVFFAKLQGYAESYAFSPTDMIGLTGAKRTLFLRSLVESNFVGKEWRIRRNATHARSRTYTSKDSPQRAQSNQGD